MPRGDSTGPMGMSPMTGRMAGFCAGHNIQGYLNKVGGRGFGTGFGRRANFGGRGEQGRGFGRRNRFFATGVPGRTWANPDPEAEKQALTSQAEYLQSEMDAIKKRLDELTGQINE